MTMFFTESVALGSCFFTWYSIKLGITPSRPFCACLSLAVHSSLSQKSRKSFLWERNWPESGFSGNLRVCSIIVAAMTESLIVRRTLSVSWVFWFAACRSSFIFSRWAYSSSDNYFFSTFDSTDSMRKSRLFNASSKSLHYFLVSRSLIAYAMDSFCHMASKVV